jgi:tetrahydromethanopterin S-methyltransferase subunit B
MPLSEEEQNILREIEAQLSASDPDLVETVARETVYRSAGRTMRWAALGFVAGLAIVILTVKSSVLLAFAGFLLMLACVLVAAGELRRMGRAGLQTFSSWRGERSGNDGDWRERFRRGR